MASILVTRRLPSSVLRMLESAGSVDLNAVDTGTPREQLLARMAGKDALVSVLTDTIDRQALARMKCSAYLINTSVGPVVDEAALVWALEQHLIAGAALDVYEREPQVDPGLFAFENVLLVPHLGSATREARTAMAQLAADNVVAVLAGRPPLTPVL